MIPLPNPLAQGLNIPLQQPANPPTATDVYQADKYYQTTKKDVNEGLM
jgi:hypothetical protein